MVSTLAAPAPIVSLVFPCAIQKVVQFLSQSYPKPSYSVKSIFRRFRVVCDELPHSGFERFLKRFAHGGSSGISLSRLMAVESENVQFSLWSRQIGRFGQKSRKYQNVEIEKRYQPGGVTC